MTTTPAAPAAEPEPAAWMYTRKNATYPNIGLHSKVSKGRWMPVPTGWTETPLYTADQLQALIEERDRLREVAVDIAASLAAAISLLERGGKAAKKAAASDKMFDQMMLDYNASLDRARAALAGEQ